MSENILQIKNLSKYFGGLAAVSNCSLKIKKNSIKGLNEQGVRELTKLGFYKKLDKTLNSIHKRLSK